MRTAFVPVTCRFPNGAFPVLPFHPRWMTGLNLHDRGVFCALLELSWCELPPCYLPNGPGKLRQMLVARYTHPSWDQPVSPAVLSQFQVEPANGLLFFPPLLAAYRSMHEVGNPYEVFRLKEA